MCRTPIEPIYWTKNVADEGADRLPAPSTAMSVIVLSPVWVTYTTARSPVVAWSRTAYDFRGRKVLRHGGFTKHAARDLTSSRCLLHILWLSLH
jgi:hypothetical protein